MPDVISLARPCGELKHKRLQKGCGDSRNAMHGLQWKGQDKLRRSEQYKAIYQFIHFYLVYFPFHLKKSLILVLFLTIDITMQEVVKKISCLFSHQNWEPSVVSHGPLLTMGSGSWASLKFFVRLLDFSQQHVIWSLKFKISQFFCIILNQRLVEKW